MRLQKENELHLDEIQLLLKEVGIEDVSLLKNNEVEEMPCVVNY